MNNSSTLLALVLFFMLPGCHKNTLQKSRRINHIEQLYQTILKTYQPEQAIISHVSQEELPCALQEYILVQHDRTFHCATMFASRRYANFPFVKYKTQLDLAIKQLGQKLFWLEKHTAGLHKTLILDMRELIRNLRILHHHLVTFNMYRQEKKILDERQLRTIARHGGLPGLIYLFFTA